MLKFFKLLMVLVCSIALVNGYAASENEVDLSRVYFVADYDPDRDPSADLEQAITQATNSNRHILLEVGGDWCVWCHILDDFLQEEPEVANALAQNFVVIKINYGEENYNEAFLEQYPQAAGYPHFYILNQQGALIQSQNTLELEAGESYSTEVFLDFLERWGP